MNINDAFPSKWLAANDLGGQDRIVTIRGDVTMEELGQGSKSEVRPVLWFNETQKGLALNKTNGSTIGDLLGGDTAQWAGKRITLFPTQTDYQGKQVACIRVRLQAPTAAQPAQTAGTTSTVPAEDMPF